MLFYSMPIILVILSNIIYHICAKNVPNDINPFITLVITYIISTIVTIIVYIITQKEHNILKEIEKVNYVPFIMGLSIVGLEVGYIFAYKIGWPIGIAAIVENCFVVISLIIIGVIFYHETLTWNKVVGIIVCMVGLILINYK